LRRGKHLAVRAARLCSLARQRRFAGPPGGSYATRVPAQWKAKTVTASSVRRRLIGAALRRCREDAGYTLDEPARLLDCDRSKVSRIETGVRGIRPKELRELLDDYGVCRGRIHLANRQS
jgi:hypothetical protein